MTKISLVELIINDYSQNINLSNTEEKILNEVKPSIWIFSSYPSKAIDDTIQLNNKRTKKGPELKSIVLPDKIPNLSVYPFDFQSLSSNNVIVHTLNSSEIDRVSYGVTSKFERFAFELRILELNTNNSSWRTPSPLEQEVFRYYLRQERSKEFSLFDNSQIYGSYLDDKKFRIIDRSFEDKGASKNDKRKVHDGRVCCTWNKNNILDLLYRLNIPAPKPSSPLFSLLPDTDDMINYIKKRTRNINLSDFSDDKLAYFYRWFNSSVNNVENICNILYQYFINNNLLLTSNQSLPLPKTISCS